MKIGLSMIVKNEAHVIERCFNSILQQPIIDFYYIVDTGSTDGTQDIIKNYFIEKNIPGEVVDYPFVDDADRATHRDLLGVVDFRNEALRGITGKVDYILCADADEQVQYSAEFNLQKFKKEITKYDIIYLKCAHNGISHKSSKCLIKSDTSWEWHGYAHEFLRNSHSMLNSMTTDDISFIYNEDGASWANKDEKISRYIYLLLKQYEEEPKDGRWLFYLAQTYRAIDSVDAQRKAIEYYEKRVQLWDGHSRDTEAYVSKLLSLCIRRELGDSLTADNFNECAKYDTNRIEHWVSANEYYWAVKDFQTAYKHSLVAVQRFMKPPTDMSYMHIELSTYTFSCAHIHAVNCYKTERWEESLDILIALMDNIESGQSPEIVPMTELVNFKNALVNNILYCQAK